MADTINFEITTSQPEVAATLEDLRYLVFKGMAGKAPRINTTNYHWEVYDNNTQSWADTGISAVNGAPGQDGYTPTISVSQGTDGITVTISDGRPSGTTASYFIPNGQDYVLTNADKQEIAYLLDDGVPQLVTDWLDDNVTPVGSSVVVDSSLSIAGAAADAAMVGAELQRIQLPDEVKQTLLACFENVAWANENGQTYYDALETALYPQTGLVSISAVFTQGSAVIYDTDSLNTLKQYLVVTAHFDDLSSQTITTYTLSGTLTVGTSTITVSYGGKTTTFNVTVTREPYQLVEYVETDGASRIDTGVVFDGTKDIEATLIMSFNGTMPSPSSVLNGWSAGGAVGVVDNALIRLSWTDGAGDPKVTTHLGGTDLLTECKMTIQAGTATNTISVFTNTTGTKTLTRTHANVSDRTFLPFPLFALSLQSSFEYAFAGLRIQSAVIKIDGTVVRNMSACYRTADDVIGFYDSANDVFYTNAGTGTFTKGGDIS